MEFLELSFVLNTNNWFSFWSLLDFERPMFHISLDDWIIEFTANQTLGIKDSIVWILGSLIFGCITNEPFSLCEGDIRRSGSISLIIGNDLNSVILPDTNTGVCCSKIDTNCFGCVTHLFLMFFYYKMGSDIFIGPNFSSTFWNN